jgi:hypothetical protein
MWELVDLPSNCITIFYKWILHKKYIVDGSLVQHKACLVVQGLKKKTQHGL